MEGVNFQKTLMPCAHKRKLYHLSCLQSHPKGVKSYQRKTLLRSWRSSGEHGFQAAKDALDILLSAAHRKTADNHLEGAQSPAGKASSFSLDRHHQDAYGEHQNMEASNSSSDLAHQTVTDAKTGQDIHAVNSSGWENWHHEEDRITSWMGSWLVLICDLIFATFCLVVSGWVTAILMVAQRKIAGPYLESATFTRNEEVTVLLIWGVVMDIFVALFATLMYLSNVHVPFIVAALVTVPVVVLMGDVIDDRLRDNLPPGMLLFNLFSCDAKESALALCPHRCSHHACIAENLGWHSVRFVHNGIADSCPAICAVLVKVLLDGTNVVVPPMWILLAPLLLVLKGFMCLFAASSLVPFPYDVEVHDVMEGQDSLEPSALV